MGDNDVVLLPGDCRDRMMELPSGSMHACVTDPPYGLSFMGQGWDHGVPGEGFWREVYRVLKPGAYLLSFGGTRTYHRLACAIEDAGFEVRDQMAWVYGNGFPKSLDVPKAIGGEAGAEWQGWGTALKPAWEPICVARKPLIGTVAENVQAHGTGALNISGCRIGGNVPGPERAGEPSAERRYTDRGSTNFAPTPGPRGGSRDGRWPANLIHDGSDEVVGLFPETDSRPGKTKAQGYGVACYGARNRTFDGPKHDDSGSAARFFYCAKVSSSERGTYNKHPTVKPVVLMQWLVRLVTPPGGTVLDPFAGSGSTGAACVREGFRAILCEITPEYLGMIRERVESEAGTLEVIE